MEERRRRVRQLRRVTRPSARAQDRPALMGAGFFVRTPALGMDRLVDANTSSRCCQPADDCEYGVKDFRVEHRVLCVHPDRLRDQLRGVGGCLGAVCSPNEESQSAGGVDANRAKS